MYDLCRHSIQVCPCLLAELAATVKTFDAQEIEVALADIQSHGLTQELGGEVREAWQLARTLNLHELSRNVINMDQKTMSEIRRYQRPPGNLHRVMKATFLLLGQHEGITEVRRPECGRGGGDEQVSLISNIDRLFYILWIFVLWL